MAFLLSDVKTAAQARGYESDSTTAQTQMVRSALRRLYGMRRWTFLETRTTLALGLGVSVINFSAVVGDPVHAVDALRLFDGTTELPLDYLPPQQLEDAAARTVGTLGAPLYWTRHANTLELDISANKAYSLQLDYLAVPVLPSVDGSTITWPDEYMDVLTEALVADLAFRQRDWQARADAGNAYRERLHEMIQAYSADQRQQADQVTSSGYWDGGC